LAALDARRRGHDGKNSPTAHLTNYEKDIIKQLRAAIVNADPNLKKASEKN